MFTFKPQGQLGQTTTAYQVFQDDRNVTLEIATELGEKVVEVEGMKLLLTSDFPETIEKWYQKYVAPSTN